MTISQRFRNGSLDEKDTEILETLHRDGRASLADLARNVGLSSPSVSERIKRLEDAGVIEGFSAVINPKALGLNIGAWLRIRPIPGKLEKVAEILQGINEIVECDRITGEDCFVAKAFVAEVEDIARLVDRITPYAMTNTSIIQTSPVKRRLVPLPKKKNAS